MNLPLHTSPLSIKFLSSSKCRILIVITIPPSNFVDASDSYYPTVTPNSQPFPGDCRPQPCPAPLSGFIHRRKQEASRYLPCCCPSVAPVLVPSGQWACIDPRSGSRSTSEHCAARECFARAIGLGRGSSRFDHDNSVRRGKGGGMVW
jgi:hypothetical protein